MHEALADRLSAHLRLLLNRFLCYENFSQTRLTSAREEWHKEVAQSTQVEVDRALSTAREAWVANYEDELEERVNQLEGSLRERLASEYAKEKKQLIEDTLREAQSKFEAEKKKLEDEIRRHKVCIIYQRVFTVEQMIGGSVQSVSKTSL